MIDDRNLQRKLNALVFTSVNLRLDCIATEVVEVENCAISGLEYEGGDEGSNQDLWPRLASYRTESVNEEP
jgi:hypothetical protein